MKLTISGSKNSESLYIQKSYKNNQGKSSTTTVRKLGKLTDLCETLGMDRDGVIAWAKEQVRVETEKYKAEKETNNVVITFKANEQMEYNQKKFFLGGYLFPQSIYYNLKLDYICKRIKSKHKFEYDLNAILSDLIYTRILEPNSKRSSFKTAQNFLEKPSYSLHDVYRSLSVLADECDFIQSEVYKNSLLTTKRSNKILYYDCTNYYFEIEQEDDDKRYGKSKEHRPNPIIQMGMFTDGDGIPLAFSLFPGNQNEQKSLKPLEQKVIRDFGCHKFIYCSDAGLASESIREFNNIGERSFIVTQSIKKLKKEEKEWALDTRGFRRLSDGKEIEDISKIDPEDKDVYYKEDPYTPKRIHQNLIVTYSSKYAMYQKTIREKQIERANKMLAEGKHKRTKKNPNDPARFISQIAVTNQGEVADKKIYALDEEKIAEESRYDGLYALCTDLLDDDPKAIINVSEGRWQIEACFRNLKTDFQARPVYVRTEQSITSHFLVCFLALLIYKLLEKKLNKKYTCDEILDTLKAINFADIQEQGYMPLYERNKITDDLHDICGFRTDFNFITKQKMRTIQKNSKRH
jgi:transposase